MKKFFYLAIAAMACIALFASCEREDTNHTGGDSGNLYGAWTLTTKTTVTRASDGSTASKEEDYTPHHFYLVLSEFPFPHAIAKKGSLTALDLDDVDVDAVGFAYDAASKTLTFKKTLWLSDDLLTYNMLLSGAFNVTELGKNKLVIQQTAGSLTTVYSYRKEKTE